MKYRPVQILTAGSILVLGLASCSNDSASPSPLAGGTTGSTPASASNSPATSNATLTVSDSPFGGILTDDAGRTVYLFTVDKNGESACYEGCDTTWPPLEADGPAVAGEGVDDSLLGTTERTDGTDQVTYADHPLYYFADDKAPGDTAGQGVGDVWYVVSASGDAVKGGAGESSSPSDDKGGMYG